MYEWEDDLLINRDLMQGKDEMRSTFKPQFFAERTSQLKQQAVFLENQCVNLLLSEASWNALDILVTRAAQNAQEFNA